MFVDQVKMLTVNESQKSMMLEIQDAEKILNHLESEELQFKYCRLCEAVCDENHFTSKSHLKRREEFQLKESEDLSLSMLIFTSTPGDITPELQKEKEKALKRKVKRIK